MRGVLIAATLLCVCSGCGEQGLFRDWFDSHKSGCDECGDGDGMLCSDAQFRLECELETIYPDVPYVSFARALRIEIVTPHVKASESFLAVPREELTAFVEEEYVGGRIVLEQEGVPILVGEAGRDAPNSTKEKQ